MDPAGPLALRDPQALQEKADVQAPRVQKAAWVRQAPQESREARGILAPWVHPGQMAWQELQAQLDHQAPPDPLGPRAQHWLQVLTTWKAPDCPSGPQHEVQTAGREWPARLEPRETLAQQGPPESRERSEPRVPVGFPAFQAERVQRAHGA